MSCVTDSNILIDLYNAGLILDFFSLGFELVAPDVILGELNSVDTQRLFAHGLGEIHLNGEQISRVTQLTEKYPHPSPRDLTALVASMDMKCDLLTGDANLRQAAELEGVNVHGLLWIFDQFLAKEIITPSRASAALNQSIELGAWLPKSEVTRRF